MSNGRQGKNGVRCKSNKLGDKARPDRIARRKRALRILEEELKSGLSRAEGSPKQPLTNNQCKRIEKEITNLKAKL